MQYTTGLTLEDIETGSEKDMQVCQNISGSKIGAIDLGVIFSQNPLIGNHLLSLDSSNKIIGTARTLISNALQGGSITVTDKLLIAVSIIHIAKGWKYENDGGFWQFIAEQLGFKEIDNKVYFILTNSLEDAMKSQDRFFIENSRRREFYATVLSHAFSPLKSMYAFFDFLFEFYKDNLKFNYIENDIAIQRLVSSLSNRMMDTASSTDVAINSNYYSIQIGLKWLILRKPQYVQNLVNEILCKLDKLFYAQILKEDTYLDFLINSWFVLKYQQLCKCKGRTRNRSALPPVMHYSKISIRYQLKDYQEVVLTIPEIRLKGSCAEQPVLDLQIGRQKTNIRLDTYGNEYARTIDEKSIEIMKAVNLNLEKDLQICTRIMYDNITIYDSGESMFRDILFFQADHEIAAQKVTIGDYLLFSPRDGLRLNDCCESRIVREYPNYLLLAINLREGFSVSLNGKVVCIDTHNPDVCVILSEGPIDGAKYVIGGKEYSIFTSNFSVSVSVPKSINIKKYLVSTGKLENPLMNYYFKETDDSILCVVPMDKNALGLLASTVTLVDIEKNKPVWGIYFCIIEGLQFHFDRPYYFGLAELCKIKITTDEGVQSEETLGSEAAAVMPYKGGVIRIDLPIIIWYAKLTGSEQEEVKGLLWHERVTQQARVYIDSHIPATCQVLIDNHPINTFDGKGLFSYDIGNYLFSNTNNWGKSVITVDLKTTYNKKTEYHNLFSIAVEGLLEEEPRFLSEDRSLIWQNPYIFVGSELSTLEFEFRSTKAEKSYQYNRQDGLLSSSGTLPDGVYAYSVFQYSRTLFSVNKKLIRTGKCILGDINEFRFENKVIQISNIIEFNNRHRIKPIFISSLKYKGIEKVDCEAGEYPLYIGYCYFQNMAGHKIYLSNKDYQNASGLSKYKVNPVHLHVLNGSLLSMTNEDHDGLYMNRERGVITDYEPTKSTRESYTNPDFYEYELLGEL